MFMYLKKPYYNIDNISCMAEYLFKVQGQNRLKQNGLLKRFTLRCIGNQETYESLRLKKSLKYKELKRNTEEWEFYFLKYIPKDNTLGGILKKRNTNSISKSTSGAKSKSKTKKKKKKKYIKKTKKKKIFSGWLGKMGI